MTNTEPQSILAGPKGREINVEAAYTQLGRTTRMRVGFVHDTLMYDRDYIKFQVTCTPKRKHWVIIKLDRDDTYSIEFGRLKNKFDWHVAAQTSGIYGDVLGEVVERMYEEVYS